MNRQSDLDAFYGLLGQLEARTDGYRRLGACDGKMPWPERGVYFFFEPGEHRFTAPDAPRVVRVGTHALAARSRTTLWKRLRQHRGTNRQIGGNHRGSIFRLLSGEALMTRDPDFTLGSWGRGANATSEIRDTEREHEARVSQYLRNMTLLFVEVPDEPGPTSARGIIERNSIALLSNFVEPNRDGPSPDWLGLHSGRERVRRSGLWNNNHVDEAYDSNFLNMFEDLVNQTNVR